MIPVPKGRKEKAGDPFGKLRAGSSPRKNGFFSLKVRQGRHDWRGDLPCLRHSDPFANFVPVTYVTGYYLYLPSALGVCFP
ncbi:MAG TPA: hypothetical protein VGM92_00900 [Candidatus Kapabacteria bacterium]|jgi:hypothetical protein